MKKMIKRFGKLYFLLYMLLALTGLLLSSCKNNVMGMLSDLNDNFLKRDVPYDNSLKPGDEGFDESCMLLSTYSVGNRMSFALVAPEASRYLWTLYSLEKEKNAIWTGKDTVKETLLECIPLEERQSQSFGFFVPEYKELTVGTYKLRLQVADEHGNIYQDVCELVIYDQYYLETMED